jgi:hypothetical protein
MRGWGLRWGGGIECNGSLDIVVFGAGNVILVGSFGVGVLEYCEADGIELATDGLCEITDLGSVRILSGLLLADYGRLHEQFYLVHHLSLYRSFC